MDLKTFKTGGNFGQRAPNLGQNDRSGGSVLQFVGHKWPPFIAKKDINDLIFQLSQTGPFQNALALFIEDIYKMLLSPDACRIRGLFLFLYGRKYGLQCDIDDDYLDRHGYKSHDDVSHIASPTQIEIDTVTLGMVAFLQSYGEFITCQSIIFI